MVYMDGSSYSFLMELIRYTHPLVYIGALLPIGAALFIWIGFSKTYQSKLRAITKDLKRVLEKVKEAQVQAAYMENLNLFEEAFGQDAALELRRPLMRAKRDADKRGENSFLSEGKAYFNFDKIIKTPGGRDYIARLWLTIILIGIIGRLLPIIMALFIMGAPGGLSMVLGYFAVIFLCLGQIIFSLVDYKIYKKAVKAYQDFIDIFDEIIPVAGELDGPALLIEATKENKEAFLESADRIEKALGQSSDQVITRAVLPVIAEIKQSLNQAMDAFSRRHESEMKFMVESFMARLTEVMETRIKALGLSLDPIEKSMTSINSELEKNIGATKGVMEDQAVILNKAVSLFEKTADVQDQVRNMYLSLDEKTEKLTLTIGKIEESSEKFIGQSLDASIKTSKGQQEFSKKLQLYIEEIREESKKSQDAFIENIDDFRRETFEWEKEAGTRLDNITIAMNDAVLTAGKELGMGLLEVTTENAKAIEDLTKASGDLRKDYDSYFGRIENSSKETLDDMTYHMQSLMARITDETLAELKKLLEQNREILTGYQDGTADLLNSFDEQARSIGLYAKEMNYDINKLSETLKEAVDGFTESAKESIDTTMNSFDTGLAELSERIANTVESIVDAVENLPKALEREIK